MNQDIKKIALCLGLPMVVASSALAQQKMTGRVVNSANEPISEVVITCPGCKTVRSSANGTFTLVNVKEGAVVSFIREGYYTKTEYVKNISSTGLNVYLIEEDNTRYNETTLLPYSKKENDPNVVGVTNVNRKDFALGSLSIDKALKGTVAGLNVINKSGMTGEGAYMQLRGVKSLMAENSPLVVINGVPYMPDMNVSQIVNGYSRSVFQALNGQDIRNITVLKGADAAIYGSLASNGVILIETDQATSTDVNTRISFSAVYGTNWNNKRIPLMESAQYKGYLSDIGMTYYPNMEQFFGDFSFLSDPNANKAYLYQYNTDWQDEIYRSSSTMDLLFRVEGGDNIAKYNISLGYLNDEGTLKNTSSQRYNAQVNASVLVSKQFEIQAAINAAYLNGDYQEQGMSMETNPLLAAYRRSPLLSPWKSDMYGNLINKYSSYWYGAIENEDFIVSNPVALVGSLYGKNRQYDMNAKVQLIYRPLKNLTLNAVVGMYYNYNQEEAFIPGINNNDISPLFDQYGKSENSTRVGTNHTFNMFYGANAAYSLQASEQHQMNFLAGFQALMTSYEYDAAFGRNSSNDFYQTLGDAQSLGKYFSGYNNKWNWLNWFAKADYTFDHLVKVGVTASFDGASSIGKDATRMTFYPAGELVLMAKQLPLLRELDVVNKLNLFANYGVMGNSRYSSKLGKYYYTSTPYQTIAGIVRANVPNTKLKAERDYTLNLGLETALWNNRIQLGATYYSIQAKDVLMTGQRSSILGTSTYYNNDGEIDSKGVELSLAVVPVYNKDWKWTIGGNLTTLSNQVKSLGNINEIISTLDDDAQVITRVGEDPYAFYGFKTKGVFATTDEAKAAHLTNRSGIAYEAGDVHFVDVNDDHIINDADRQVIGSATPDFFGSVFSRLEYKNFALDITLAYSVGNDAYNAVRRVTESGKDFSNQSVSMARRWSMEGQQTDIPRVSYGDKVGNNEFSDRWIEDASYLKLRDITLSYTWDKPLFNFILGGTVFVTGENLFTITDYLGLDPEFSFSNSTLLQGVDYAKVCAPRSVKFGVNLKF
ncbi:MAG: SusC/RagA family TonB-linked outer membrane protein [Prevotella sp.]|nr:SusC/RagA family TonB-linked outer membrane protein [Prevotella sp.]